MRIGQTKNTIANLLQLYAFTHTHTHTQKKKKGCQQNSEN